MSVATVDTLARTLLYEGYLLYPYRPSSVKNRQRFNFGVLYPESYGEVKAGAEQASMQTEVLVRGGPGTIVNVRVRFLQLIESSGAPGWQEATEREIRAASLTLKELACSPQRTAIAFPAPDPADRDADQAAGGEQAQPSTLDPRSSILDAFSRRQCEILGAVETSAQRLDDATVRITVRVTNRTPLSAGTTLRREDAIMHALVSTHTILTVEEGEFVSLLDTPAELREAAMACRNVGCWPVLVGAEGQRDTTLASPIILYDHPQIAPESVGDLFDGTEIDEILSLRILTLTDDEKREMSRSDERARRLLQRTESMSPEQWMKLHGMMRPALAEGLAP